MKSFIQRITNQEVSIWSWLCSFGAIITIRFFLEALSNKTNTGTLPSDASTFVHYFLFFLSFALIFMFFLKKRVLRKEDAHLAPRLSVVAMSAIFIAPIIDYLWSFFFSKQISMSYMFGGTKDLFYKLITFFGPNIYTGITIGIRIEVAIILISIFVISYKIHKSWMKAVINSLLLYFIIFIFLSLPSILAIVLGNAKNYGDALNFYIESSGSFSVLNNIHNSLDYKSFVRFIEISFNFILAKIFFITTIIIYFLWLFYSPYKQKLIAIIKNSRPERVVHYMIMIVVGILIGGNDLFVFKIFNWLDWLSLIIIFLSFYFSWMFAVSTNDIEDVEIDRISNKNRPLVTEKISKSELRDAGFVFLGLSLVGGFISGFGALFFLLAFTTLYYIYSAPPTKFKTVPFFSSFIIGLCCLTAVLAGFITFSIQKDISLFPAKIAIGIVFLFFLWSNIRDMKDIEGDRTQGISTLPVLFGKRGPKITGLITSLAYILAPLFFGTWVLLPSLMGAIFNYYFITKNDYKEKYVFIVYKLFITSLFILYFWYN